MLAFTQGIDHVYDEFKFLRLNEYKYPEIRVISEENLDSPQVECINGGREITIKKKFLEQASKHDINSIRAPRSKTGEVILEETTPNIFGLLGVEEGHHAAFLQIDHSDTSSILRESSFLEYHATEHEYYPLKWKISFAKKKNMSPKTIALLENQLKEVTELRKKPIIKEIP